MLIITNQFSLNSGNQRARKLAERAVQSLDHGWETVVLYPQGHGSGIPGEDRIKIYEASTPSFLKPFISIKSQGNTAGTKKNANCFLKKLRSMFERLFRFLCFPDTFFPWIIPMYRKGLEIVRKENINAIDTMCYPFSLHLIGLFLKRKYKLPWLVEFRDAWVKEPDWLNGERNIFWLKGEGNVFHKVAEKKVVQSCDKVVTNYGVQINLEYFYETYPDLPRNKFDIITCPGFDGFNFEKYRDVKPLKWDKFTISYAGSLYGNNPTVESFLRGLSLFIKEHQLSQKHILVNFFGNWDSKHSELAKELGLEPIIHPYGRIPYDECLSYLRGSDILLLIVRNRKGDELNVPGKVTDYIAAGKSILALVKKSWEAAKFISANNVGIVADPDNPEEIAEALTKLYLAFTSRVNYYFLPLEDFVKSLDSKRQVEKICALLEEINEEGEK